MWSRTASRSRIFRWTLLGSSASTLNQVEFIWMADLSGLQSVRALSLCVAAVLPTCLKNSSMSCSVQRKWRLHVLAGWLMSAAWTIRASAFALSMLLKRAANHCHYLLRIEWVAGITQALEQCYTCNIVVQLWRATRVPRQSRTCDIGLKVLSATHVGITFRP